MGASIYEVPRDCKLFDTNTVLTRQKRWQTRRITKELQLFNTYRISKVQIWWNNDYRNFMQNRLNHLKAEVIKTWFINKDFPLFGTYTQLKSQIWYNKRWITQGLPILFTQNHYLVSKTNAISIEIPKHYPLFDTDEGLSFTWHIYTIKWTHLMEKVADYQRITEHLHKTIIKDLKMSDGFPNMSNCITQIQSNCITQKPHQWPCRSLISDPDQLKVMKNWLTSLPFIWHIHYLKTII